MDDKWEWKNNNMKTLRKLHKEKQEDLSKALFVNRSNLSEWENGKTIPALDTVKRIADHYNVTIDYLCGIPYEKTFSLSDMAMAKLTQITPKQKAVLDRLVCSGKLFDILDAFNDYADADENDIEFKTTYFGKTYSADAVSVMKYLAAESISKALDDTREWKAPMRKARKKLTDWAIQVNERMAEDGK